MSKQKLKFSTTLNLYVKKNRARARFLSKQLKLSRAPIFLGSSYFVFDGSVNAVYFESLSSLSQRRQLCFPIAPAIPPQSCRLDQNGTYSDPRRRRQLFLKLLQLQYPCWSCRGQNQPLITIVLCHPSHSLNIVIGTAPSCQTLFQTISCPKESKRIL